MYLGPFGNKIIYQSSSLSFEQKDFESFEKKRIKHIRGQKTHIWRFAASADSDVTLSIIELAGW